MVSNSRLCIVKGCKTNSLSQEERGKMLCLPRNDNLRAKWINQLDRNDLVGLPYKKITHFRVCHLHFEDRDFFTSEKKKLLNGRIPQKVQQDAVEVKPDPCENIPLSPRTPRGVLEESPSTSPEFVEVQPDLYANIPLSPRTPSGVLEDTLSMSPEFVEVKPDPCENIPLSPRTRRGVLEESPSTSPEFVEVKPDPCENIPLSPRTPNGVLEDAPSTSRGCKTANITLRDLNVTRLEQLTSNERLLYEHSRHVTRLLTQSINRRKILAEKHFRTTNDNWRIHGFVDNGTEENECSNKIADHILVFMIRSIADQLFLPYHKETMNRTLQIGANIKFCFKLGKTATETFEMIKKAHGEEAMSRKNIFKWFAFFRDGGEDIEDETWAPKEYEDCRRHSKS